jgi:hypothetical protein
MFLIVCWSKIIIALEVDTNEDSVIGLIPALVWVDVHYKAHKFQENELDTLNWNMLITQAEKYVVYIVYT